jgi:biopolymer transport protein ExbD
MTPVAQINITPMVDVMMVFLVIFMLVTPAVIAGFHAQLPEGVYLEERPEHEDRVVLGIDRAGRYYLNSQPIAREAVTELLAEEFAARPGDRVLFIMADRELEFREIRTAMRFARAAGVHVAAAVTEQRASTAIGRPSGAASR